MSALRVLVVDPHQDNRDSLALLLRLWGNEVRVVPDGPAALQQTKTFRPHVVLTELALPGMDGWQLARELREQETDSPTVLIALTCSGRKEDLARSEQAGFDYLFVKPADPHVLHEVLKATARDSSWGKWFFPV